MVCLQSDLRTRMSLRSSLHIAAALCVLGVSLLASLELFKLVRQPPPPDQDALYIARFDEIKRALPARGVVCYVTTSDDSFTAKKNYFLAQYALAPLVVRTTADCDPLIGDFPASSIPPLDSRRFVVLRNFGNGLTLLGRNTGQ
jgi:hypothetical protein